MTKLCTRCKTEKPKQDWAPSQWADGAWCRECYREWHRSRYIPKNGGNDSPRPCDRCGESYIPKVRTQTMYCSRPCKEDARKDAEAAARLARKTTRPPCPICGGVVPPQRRSDLAYCSTSCSTKARALDGRQSVARRKHNRKRYGLTDASFKALLAEQGGGCAICKTTDLSKSRHGVFHIDHDHATGVTRGLLCGPCNVMLGHAQDNPARLRAAADYLDTHNSRQGPLDG